MLQFIRDRAQGWIAWVIVGLIIIPFALWGLNQYVGGGGEIAAAEVNGQEISQRLLQETYYRQRQRLQQMFGDQLPEELFSESSMKKQLLQQLIEDEVILQSGFSSKMRVGNDQLVATIHSIDAFKESGQFSNELYERVLRTQGMQPGGFEARLRRDLMLQQYRGGIEGSEFTTPVEKKMVADLNQQQRQIEYVTVPVSNFSLSASVTSDEIQSYYEQNQTKYRTPEMVKVSYVELKQDAIASEIEVEESVQKERYDAQILNYKTPEERRARHILIMDDDDAKAKQEADAVLARVNAGESFEELAKELSKDPGSASQGGDLGFFGLGLMDKAFEDAAYQLQIGEVSPVIKSEFGYHIIKLEEIRGGVTKSFAEVKDQILAEIQQEHAEKGFYDQAELLANYTYEQPDTLQVAAEQLNLSIQQTPLFGRNGGTGIAKNQKFYQAAFSEDVLQRGNNSEVIELSKTHFVVLRLDEHQPEATQPLDSVKGVIEKQLLKDKAEESAQLYAKSLIDNISAGEKPEVLAKSEKLSWSANTVTRDSKDVDRAIVSASFKMSHPQSGELTKELVKLANGDQVIVVLNAIISPDSEKAKVDEKDEKTLRKGYASASYSAIVNQLRNSSDITVNR
ncbi:MAG: SurA N-terminal domain-containing protein [Gammaproteobacteria bacterium]|nr:SurA N-terminal domain-containing protein [Gammaproteobacteria bacterium]